MSVHLEEIDLRLLDCLQQEVPLVEHPFGAVGQKLGINEAEVLRRVSLLKNKPVGVIRQISAIFDSHKWELLVF